MRRRTLRRKGWISQAEMADVQMKIALSENGKSKRVQSWFASMKRKWWLDQPKKTGYDHPLKWAQ